MVLQRYNKYLKLYSISAIFFSFLFCVMREDGRRLMDDGRGMMDDGRGKMAEGRRLMAEGRWFMFYVKKW